MRVSPIYSKRRGTKVYHNNNECPERNNIERRYLVRGTGGKRLCHRCKEYNAKGK